jgi:SagB-type dehydrogenase family enzyme
MDDIGDLVPSISPDELQTTVRSLIDVNALIEDGSDLAQREEAIAKGWQWGMPAALFHFSVQDRTFMTIEETEAAQVAKLSEESPPPLYLTHDDDAGSIELPQVLGGNDLLQLMARRRTVRSAARPGIGLRGLAECLFAGMGITGHTQNVVGALPLSMTPSGGARNPYEAFVYARAVEGLDRGFYHYSAFNHSLRRLATEAQPLPSELLGGQQWADDMPCIILLCAYFARTMWKYEDANAYRVVLIEAGHIGQNIMLAATERGMSACPTAALSHSVIQRLIGLDNPATEWPIYALTLAHPSAGH